MIVLAYNYEGYVISIVNTRSLELAHAFWQGKGLTPHSTRTVEDKEDFISIEEHLTGVYEILKTVEAKGYEIAKDKKVILISK